LNDDQWETREVEMFLLALKALRINSAAVATTDFCVRSANRIVNLTA